MNQREIFSDAGNIPEMTIDDFEVRATQFVDKSIQNLRSDKEAASQYTYDDALKEDLRRSFHRFVMKHFVLVDAKSPAPR